MKRNIAFAAAAAVLLAALAGCGAASGTASASPAASAVSSGAASESAASESAASGTAAGPAQVKPMDGTIDLTSPEDGIYPAGFTAADVQTGTDGTTLTVTLYSMDVYDAVAVNALKAGDTITVAGETIAVQTVKTDSDGTVCINGGLEQGGVDLVPGDGGTYQVRGMDDYASYTVQGQATLAFAPEMVFTDRSDLQNADGTVTKGADFAAAVQTMENQSFTCYNTTVRVRDGRIVEMTRIYTP